MMSKRNIEGDVLSNRLAVGMAKRQRQLVSMLGPNLSSENADEKLQREQEREDLEDESFGPEQIGMDAPILKNIKDGSFTHRTLTTNDKLLQTLIGKKAARAHITAKQTTQKNATPINFEKKPTKLAKPTKPVESDDEDEGRTAAFKSKRQRTKKRQPVPIDSDEPKAHENAPETDPPRQPASADMSQEKTPIDGELATVSKKDPGEDNSGAEKPSLIKSRKPSATKRSYLDEILAERSKKMKNKKRNQEKAAS